MKHFAWILVLLVAAIPSSAATKMTASQMKDKLVSMHQAAKEDSDVADFLRDAQLTEQLTPAAMSDLLALLPGPLSNQQIEIHQGRSAFLPPPAADIPNAAAPDAGTQKAIFGKAADYAVKSYSQNPHLTASKATSRYQDGFRLRNLWFTVASHYRSKGNLDVKVTPQPQFDESSSTVSYNVAIDPGPVYHLAFVKFENASDELRSLLIRNWQMLPGDPFDETYVGSFIAKVQDHDATLRRSLTGVKTKFDVTADPQSHDVNVVIRLER
jgi:hypothetical protein